MDNPTADRQRPGEPANPVADYDREHGDQGDTIPHVSEEQAWGTNLNPVRENHTSYKNLKQV